MKDGQPYIIDYRKSSGDENTLLRDRSIRIVASAHGSAIRKQSDESSPFRSVDGRRGHGSTVYEDSPEGSKHNR